MKLCKPIPPGQVHTEDLLMPIEEFRQLGLLHEINRRILHPLGIAMVVLTDGTGQRDDMLYGVLDYRDDPEGVAFDGETLQPQLVQRFDEEWERRRPAREAALGYMIQPVEGEETP